MGYRKNKIEEKKTPRPGKSDHPELTKRPQLRLNKTVFQEYQPREEGDNLFFFIPQRELIRLGLTQSGQVMWSILNQHIGNFQVAILKISLSHLLFCANLSSWDIDHHTNQLILKVKKEDFLTRKDPEDALLDIDRELGL